jgi:thiol-disulfide isomerase/thioredoxin
MPLTHASGDRRRRALFLLATGALLFLMACKDDAPAGAAGTAGAAKDVAAAAADANAAVAADLATPADTPAAAWAQARAVAGHRLDALQFYDVAAAITVDTRALAGTDSAHSELAFSGAGRWPDRLRVTQDEAEPMLAFGTGPGGSWFHYVPMNAAYAGPPQKLNRDLAAAARLDLDEQNIFAFYAGLGPLLLPEGREPDAMPQTESLNVGGRDIPCQVFSLPALPAEAGGGGPVPGPARLWFDPASGFCLKIESHMRLNGRGGEADQSVTTAVTRLDLAATPADDRFAYAPPAGVRVAQSLDQLTNPESLTGQPVPDVTLTGLDGKPIRLADLRGKVVYLDIWATWCGPCRMEMPHLEALNKELGPDRVFFVCASSEDQPVIEQFLTRNPYTLRIARITEGDARDKFKARSIPAGFVIDKDGIIRAHLVGAQNEEQLRRALARAGVGG